MLQITVSGGEYFDPKTNRFYTLKDQTLTLEHSLVSISKWESKFKKSFFSTFSKRDKSLKEIREYIRCMTLTQNVNPIVYKKLSAENYEQVFEYINDPMTATTFREDRKAPSRKVVTSEEIYYQMVVLGIPFECQKWHFNRLVTLIRVCQEKQKSPNKNRKFTPSMFKARNDLNEARLAALHSKG